MVTAFARTATATGIIRYSQVWEDCDLLGRALSVTPDDDVLSIGSAGDNVLALLFDEPRSITALDLNPAQSALVELKLTGFRVLPYDQLVCLVGARDNHDRLDLYRRVRPHLSASARRFWDERPDALATGVLHAGRLDRYFQVFQREHLAQLVPAGAVADLLTLDDRAAQRELFARYFDTPEFRARFCSYFSRETLARDGRDPSQFCYVGDLDVPAMLWERFRYACTDIATLGNHYLEYFLTARYRDLELGPPHLRRDAFAPLVGLVDRVEIVTDELGSHLDEVGPGHYSKANLSDLFEYVSEAQTEALFRKLVGAVRPGGRLAFWNLFVPRAPGPASRARLRSHTASADALWRSDRAFFYRAFHLEEVLP